MIVLPKTWVYDGKSELFSSFPVFLSKVPIPWTLNAVVRHALVPLAGLSLVDGQPVIPELGAALIDVLADPRLGPSQRREIERVLLESEDLEGELAAEAYG